MKVNGLRVAAHSSTFTFKGKPADAREVGAKLHVAAVLEGTVRRAGSKLRITAQLVSASDGLALWSERYERESKDVFKVQDDITGAIVSALRLKLGANSSPNQNRREENVEAHDLYLRGRFLLLKRTEAGLRKSLDYFSQALAKDPGYAPAYDSIADAWSFLADAFVPPREGYPKAQTAAMKALELDPLDADAHSMLAGIQWWYAWDVPAAEEEFHRALQLNPNSMDAHYRRSWFLCGLKRWKEGLEEAERAIALDPLSAVPSWAREYCFCMSRRYDETLAQNQKTSELDPNFFYIDSPAAIAYREKGMLAESVTEYQRIQKVTGQPVPGLAVTYARMGKAAEARIILREMLDIAARKYVSPEQVALIYANLGEKDQAFVWLEKAYEARSAWLITGILVLPQYDPIRADPRFSALLRKMQLEK
jgi:Tfp pilus assembly protein PilF